jgi:hypothetical protein
MPIMFKHSDPIRFQGVETRKTELQPVSFPNDVRAAEVAIQSFSFDFTSTTPPQGHQIDKIEVSTRRQGIGGETVTVEVTVNIAGSGEEDYNATVTALVVADVEP